jgi:DNA adenine methylase
MAGSVSAAGLAPRLSSLAFTMSPTLRSPFPWFGGKSRVGHVVWEAFGDVKAYIEPFAGSLGVLWKNPAPPRIEVVNDKDSFVSNFWRAVRHDPHTVAQWADEPSTEVDLVARNNWLRRETRTLTERLLGDPNFYDSKIAGWWVWGVSVWIGGGWTTRNAKAKHPVVMPRGVTGKRDVYEWIATLSDRLADTTVCCGDWQRVLTRSALTTLTPCGVFLDPPYDLADRSTTYAKDEPVSPAVARWAIEHGDDPRLRIALCGYEGHHDMPDTWRCHAWSSSGFFAGRGESNRHRERIWFSPHCLTDDSNRSERAPTSAREIAAASPLGGVASE